MNQQPVDNGRKYWNAVPALPAPLLMTVAQQAEAQGLHGVFAAQVHTVGSLREPNPLDWTPDFRPAADPS